MKSSQVFGAVAALALALSTAVYAKGPMGGPGHAAGTSSGAQAGSAGSASAGAGQAARDQSQARSATQTADQTRARLHTLDADGVPVVGTGTAGAGAQRGIHTPGTGLTATDGTAVVVE